MPKITKSPSTWHRIHDGFLPRHQETVLIALKEELEQGRNAITIALFVDLGPGMRWFVDDRKFKFDKSVAEVTAEELTSVDQVYAWTSVQYLVDALVESQGDGMREM